jgi:hypothetical protein
MSQAKTAKEVLIAAEWILNHLGWTQKAFFRDAKGDKILDSDRQAIQRAAKSVCLVGAIRLVDTSDEMLWQARSQLYRVINAPYTFNDAHGRTKKQVLAVLRKAIKALP